MTNIVDRFSKINTYMFSLDLVIILSKFLKNSFNGVIRPESTYKVKEKTEGETVDMINISFKNLACKVKEIMHTESVCLYQVHSFNMCTFPICQAQEKT